MKNRTLLLPFCLLYLALVSCRKQPAHTNRLIDESSPYLRQHAHNPVDWQPWDEAALQQAAAENKMLVISIGYAACHWCHVMERESFEDTTVARIMNEHFVSIKVDREERPDVDDVYMAACQLTSERGCGWPLNVFALPDGQPVWAGTYFPRKQWLATLEYFAEEWQKNPEKMSVYAQQLTEGVQRSGQVKPPTESVDFEQTALKAPVTALLEEIDFERGGRNGAPKFPMPSNYEFLLRYHHRTGREEALAAVRVTLAQMARGGIYDHLGGGFARYATDDAWRVPHFEKMLYDNAQLVRLYAHAYQATGDTAYRTILEETLTFVEREMTSPKGAFYSSLDADSEGEEGKFYTWQKEEIENVLADPALSELFCAAYGISEAGNWEGRNVLYRAETAEALTGQFELSEEEVRSQLEQARKQLFQVRGERIRPGLDNKILTSWNALMLRGYAEAFKATGTEAYRQTALRNGRFLRDVMRDDNDRLRRSYLDGKPAINAFLDDYAQTILAFIRLYEITFEEEWLHHARGLAEYAIEHFRDDSTGLFFYTSDLDPPLAVRKMELQDNVIPASNSSLARGLYYLGQYFYEESYLRRARAMCLAISGDMTDTLSPDFYSNWYSLWLDLAQAPYEVAIVGPRAGEKRDQLARRYLPDALLLGGKDEGTLELLKNKLQEGQTFIYVCRNKVCKLPVQEIDSVLELME